jgi:hypothetical protein
MATEDSSVVDALRAAMTATNVTPLVTPREITEDRLTLAASLESGTEPRFHWTYPDFDATPARRAMSHCRDLLRRHGHPFAHLVEAQLDSLEHMVETFSDRSDDGVARWSLIQHGQVPAAVLALAESILAAPAAEADGSPGRHDAAYLIARFRQAMDAHGLEGWIVVPERTLAAKVSINPLTRLIRVRESAQFSDADVDRLLAHEIGGHVLRTANALLQEQELAAVPLGHTTPTEEGLAAWLEEHFGVQSERTLRTYAARSIAASLAPSLGLYEIAIRLQPHVGASGASEIALRVKRGLSKPSAPGGYLRDHAYLTGLAHISEHLHEAPEDLVPLMATKWPLSLLPLVQESLTSGELRPPQLMPQRSLLGLGPQ